MGKISQDTAYNVSKKIVEPINKKMIEIEKQIGELCREYYLKTIPEDIKKMYEKNSEWMHTLTSVYLKSEGFNNRNVSIKGCPNNSSYGYKELPLTKEQAKALHKLDEQKEKLSNKYKTTQREIKATLLALGTTKRIAAQFPEAVAFLPEAPKENTQLMVQLQPVRTKVQCLISEDVEKKCIDKM